MGGGMPRAAAARRTAPRSPMPHLPRTRALPSFLHSLRHSCSPSVIPAPPSVIPAQAGTQTLHTPALRHPPNSHSFPNSSLPPSRGEVRWGVECHELPPPVVPRPDHSCRTSVGPALSRHSCASLRRTRAFPSFLHPLRHSCAPLRHSCAGRNAGSRRGSAAARSGLGEPSRHRGAEGRLGSCLRRNDGSLWRGYGEIVGTIPRPLVLW